MEGRYIIHTYIFISIDQIIAELMEAIVVIYRSISIYVLMKFSTTHVETGFELPTI